MSDITTEQLLALADRAAEVMRQGEAEQLRTGIAQLSDAVAQLHAGEEPYVNDYTVATPAQWIWLWNRASPEKRLHVAECIDRDAATARACFMGAHVHRLVEQQNAWHEGPGRAHTAVAMAQALANELEEKHPVVAARLRSVIGEAMEGPAPVLVPHTTTPPPALTAMTRLPAADLRDRVADAIIHALRTRTVMTEVYPGGPKTGWGLSGHELADVVLTELRNELAELDALRVGITHLAAMEDTDRPKGCGQDCDGSHMYDGGCTEDPHLEGVTTPGHELPHRPVRRADGR